MDMHVWTRVVDLTREDTFDRQSIAGLVSFVAAAVKLLKQFTSYSLPGTA